MSISVYNVNIVNISSEISLHFHLLTASEYENKP